MVITERGEVKHRRIFRQASYKCLRMNHLRCAT